MANAAIGGIFGTTLPTFLTGKSFAGTGFGSNNVNNSWELTLPEMADMLMGGKGGMNSKTFQGGIGTAIRKNLKENWISTVGQLVVIPLAFKFGRKVLAKPLINPTNRMLKTAGLGEVKI